MDRPGDHGNGDARLGCTKCLRQKGSVINQQILSNEVDIQGEYNHSQSNHLRLNLASLSARSDETSPYGCIIHVLCRHGLDGRYRENDSDEESPKDTHGVAKPAENAVAHVKWARFEHHLGVILIYLFQGNRDDVTQVECHRR